MDKMFTLSEFQHASGSRCVPDCWMRQNWKENNFVQHLNNSQQKHVSLQLIIGMTNKTLLVQELITISFLFAS